MIDYLTGTKCKAFCAKLSARPSVTIGTIQIELWQHSHMSVKRVWKVQQKRKNWHERDGKWSEKDIVSFDRTKRTGLASACKWLAQIFTWNTAIRLGISSPNKQRFSTFLHALPTALRAIFIFFAVHSKLCKLKDF